MKIECDEFFLKIDFRPMDHLGHVFFRFINCNRMSVDFITFLGSCIGIVLKVYFFNLETDLHKMNQLKIYKRFNLKLRLSLSIRVTMYTRLLWFTNCLLFSLGKCLILCWSIYIVNVKPIRHTHTNKHSYAYRMIIFVHGINLLHILKEKSPLFYNEIDI